jgi:D-sedoheptulose 7-phosphate isomerase
MMQEMKETVIREIEESIEVKKAAARNLADDITAAARTVIDAYKAGNKVLLAGNGGSAADAQHIAAELTGRFLKEREALPAIALTTDTSILTAVSNDYGFEYTFSRQIEALGKKGDVLMAITTSGSSTNILKAIETAHAKNMHVIILTGKNGASLQNKRDMVITVPSDKTPRIQEAHITIEHIICYLVEEALFGIKEITGGKGQQ